MFNMGYVSSFWLLCDTLSQCLISIASVYIYCVVFVCIHSSLLNFRGSKGGGRLIDMRRLLEGGVYFNLTETLLTY